MRYVWSEEQNLLRSTLERYVANRHGFAARAKRVDAGFDPQIWRGLAELGIFGLPFAEEYGGTEGSPLDTVIVMEQFGRGLVVEPYIPTVVLGGGLLRHAANDAQKAKYIPGLIEGELRFAFAFAEAQSRYNISNVAVTAVKQQDGYLLNGKKIVVFGAAEAHAIFLTARTSGGQYDEAGISLFIVPRDAEGLTIQPYITADGFSAAEVVFKNVQAGLEDLIGEPDAAFPVVEQVLDEAAVAVCAEAVGACAGLNERCVEYSKTRVAFGQTLSKFQVLQHRMVDMHLAYEQAAAAVLRAGLALTASATTRARAVSGCKVQVGQEADLIGKAAVQLHGAIGITEELDVGHYFKRVMMIKSTFGNADFHLRRYIRLSGGEFSGSNVNAN